MRSRYNPWTCLAQRAMLGAAGTSFVRRFAFVRKTIARCQDRLGTDVWNFSSVERNEAFSQVVTRTWSSRRTHSWTTTRTS